MTAVGGDVADRAPEAFRANTVTRMVCPMSRVVSL
jgi:hypothetical protein